MPPPHSDFASHMSKTFPIKRPCKGKSPVVRFHGITLPYSYFEEIRIFTPIQQEAKHDQETLSAELNKKVC